MRIELRNVSLKFPGKEPLFQDVDFHLENGEFVLFQGASGTGKSSLLRLMNRLEERSEGEILIDGRSIDELNVTSIRRRIGYVQQRPVILPGTIDDNLNIPFQFRAAQEQKPPGVEEKMNWMDEFLLSHLALDSEATRLSVGEQQRVALIRMLITEPEIILCDEPTSALDPQSRRIVEDAIENINLDRNTGIIMVTHQDFRPKRAKFRSLVLRDRTLSEIPT